MSKKEFIAEEIMNIVGDVLHEHLKPKQECTISTEIEIRVQELLNVLP